jgi:threonine/homoserine/homoserine lactone efflux protein
MTAQLLLAFVLFAFATAGTPGPNNMMLLGWVGGGYMLWLAWKIATTRTVADKGAGARPMTFLQAAAFQWVNPKAWAMALTAATTYTPEGSTIGVFFVAGTFMLVGAPCSAAWAGFGQGMRRFLDRPPVLRAFNLTMAALLVVSLYPLVVETRPAGAAKEAPRLLADLPPTPRWSSRG